MSGISDGVKKVLLASVGVAATTVEKVEELVDDMASKGEETIQQGKDFNKELKHNIRQSVKDKVNVSVKPSSPEELQALLNEMTPEQIQALKDEIQKKEDEIVIKDTDVKDVSDEDKDTDEEDEEDESDNE